MLDLSALSSLLFSHVARVVVDGHGRRVWLCGTPVVDLTSHPVSFDILTCVGEQAPDAVSVDAIAREAFGVRSPNASHEARLRTELLRLRPLLPPKLGRLRQERGTVRWEPTLPVVVVRPLVPRPEAHARALLADGRAWSVKSLSEAMCTSQRSVQRLLTELVGRHPIRTLGSARSTRYAVEAGTERIARRMLLLGLIADG